jgi:hypothetical protein
MDRNGQARKEPTLADLEAFEKLLRESLHAEPKPSSQTPTSHARAAHSLEAAPESGSVAQAERITPRTADEAAMAELARLIETPVDFQVPALVRPASAAPDTQSPAAGGTGASHKPHAEAPAPDADDRALAPHADQGALISGVAAIDAFAHAWPGEPQVETRYPASDRAPDAPIDPLAAFEEELRRFDAIRLGEEQARVQAQQSAGPDLGGTGLGGTGLGGPRHMPAGGYPGPAGHADERSLHGEVNANDPGAQAGSDIIDGSPYGAESAVQSSLIAAEERIAAEAAAAAAAAGASGNVRRSRGIFLALGGLVVAGLAVIGGMFALGKGERIAAGGSDIPVIAAKKDPAKEKPAEPGGLEIPNQNKQVLSPREAGEVKSAQVVTTTEQPLDLNQVTRRESVRVIAPSPYQGANTPIANQAGTPAGIQAVTAPGGTPADPASANGALEPRRVTSVRIPVGGGEAAPPVATQTPAPPATPVPPSRVPVGSGAPASGGVASSATPSIAALSAEATRAGAESALSGPAPRTPPKAETRPVTAIPAPATTIEAPAPRTETPRAAPPQRVPAPAPQRAANAAPLSLGPANEVAQPAGSTGGAFAIQLASRPSEADARAASTSLRGRYSAILSGRAPVVVSGEANGQTVYRVRVAGYSQADANEACRRIKATGGGCFVTRQ